MEDDLNFFFKLEDDLIFFFKTKMTTSKKKEDDLNKLKNGRQPKQKWKTNQST